MNNRQASVTVLSQNMISLICSVHLVFTYRLSRLAFADSNWVPIFSTVLERP